MRPFIDDIFPTIKPCELRGGKVFDHENEQPAHRGPAIVFSLDYLFVIKSLSCHSSDIYAGGVTTDGPIGTGINGCLVDDRIPLL